MVKARMIRQGPGSERPSSRSNLIGKGLTVAAVAVVGSWFLFFMDPLISPYYGAPQQAWQTRFGKASGPWPLADIERIPRRRMVIVEGYVCEVSRDEGWFQLGGRFLPASERVVWTSPKAIENFQFYRRIPIPEDFSGVLEPLQAVRAEVYSKPSIKGGIYFTATRRLDVTEPARTAAEDAARETEKREDSARD